MLFFPVCHLPLKVPNPVISELSLVACVLRHQLGSVSLRGWCGGQASLGQCIAKVERESGLRSHILSVSEVALMEWGRAVMLSNAWPHSNQELPERMAIPSHGHVTAAPSLFPCLVPVSYTDIIFKMFAQGQNDSL